MKYNLNNLVNNLLDGLNPRQKDILNSRYGLTNGQPLTLAEIGGKYGITRERVRQIEALALAAVRDKFSQKEFAGPVKLFKEKLQNCGGVCRENVFGDGLKKIVGDSQNYAQKISFVLESCGEFKHYHEDKDFYPFWYLNKASLNRTIDSISRLEKELSDGNRVGQLGIRANYISVSKKFAISPYKDFGLSCWPEICPKTSRDWAYLVLKKKGQPLHFTELTKAISNLRRDKTTNPQTVHNELIKDDRFVLVGRGTYGLKEFNLIPGTAREVIAHILKKHGPKHSRDIVQLVLGQRLFKENTLLLNLQDRRFFQRLSDGRYTIRKA